MRSAPVVHVLKIDHTQRHPPCVEPDAHICAVGWHWNTHTLYILTRLTSPK